MLGDTTVRKGTYRRSEIVSLIKRKNKTIAWDRIEPYDGFVAEGRMKVALFFLFHKVDIVHIATHQHMFVVDERHEIGSGNLTGERSKVMLWIVVSIAPYQYVADGVLVEHRL